LLRLREHEYPPPVLRPNRWAGLVAATGGAHLALEIFLIFYVTCIAKTWWFYLRKSFMAKQAPSLAKTRLD
jgi:NNP family nitrate/nitrite transporter-like MFS transporter